MEKFTLEAYSMLEKHLRQQGRKDDADRVYRKMQRAWINVVLNKSRGSWRIGFITKLSTQLKKVIRRKTPPKLRKGLVGFMRTFIWTSQRIFYGFMSRFTGFGINWRTPLLFGILQLTLSFLLCYKSSNWETRINQSSFETTDFYGDINYVGTLKAINICLPIIRIPLNQDADEGKYQLKTTGSSEFRVLPLPLKNIPPDSFSSFLSFTGWIIWPTILITITGVLRRDAASR
jgi:hypothetical protein